LKPTSAGLFDCNDSLELNAFVFPISDAVSVEVHKIFEYFSLIVGTACVYYPQHKTLKRRIVLRPGESFCEKPTL